jgi:hypothetical protein
MLVPASRGRAALHPDHIVEYTVEAIGRSAAHRLHVVGVEEALVLLSVPYYELDLDRDARRHGGASESRTGGLGRSQE